VRYVSSLLVGKPQGKKSLERSRHRGQDNINIRDIVYEDVERTYLSQDKVQWWVFM
jgi:hypothetical protein